MKLIESCWFFRSTKLFEGYKGEKFKFFHIVWVKTFTSNDEFCLSIWGI